MDKFSEALCAAVKERLRVGDGTRRGVNVGPLINEAAVKKVER